MVLHAVLSLAFLAPTLDTSPADYATIRDKCQTRMVRELNDYRRAAGRGVLTKDDGLCRAAQLYAEHCARTGGHGHYADGRSPSQRAARQGYRGGCGENWAYGPRSTSGALRMWIGSRGHRGNMLGSWRVVGVGASKHNGRYVYVQMFGN